jgi:hypothetical protein
MNFGATGFPSLAEFYCCRFFGNRRSWSPLAFDCLELASQHLSKKKDCVLLSIIWAAKKYILTDLQTIGWRAQLGIRGCRGTTEHAC